MDELASIIAESQDPIYYLVYVKKFVLINFCQSITVKLEKSSTIVTRQLPTILRILI